MTDFWPSLDPFTDIVAVNWGAPITKLDFVNDKYMVAGVFQNRADVIDRTDYVAPLPSGATDTTVTGVGLILQNGDSYDFDSAGYWRRARLKNKGEVTKKQPGALNEFTFLDCTMVFEFDAHDVHAAFLAASPTLDEAYYRWTGEKRDSETSATGSYNDDPEHHERHRDVSFTPDPQGNGWGVDYLEWFAQSSFYDPDTGFTLGTPESYQRTWRLQNGVDYNLTAITLIYDNNQFDYDYFSPAQEFAGDGTFHDGPWSLTPDGHTTDSSDDIAWRSAHKSSGLWYPPGSGETGGQRIYYGVGNLYIRQRWAAYHYVNCIAPEGPVFFEEGTRAWPYNTDPTSDSLFSTYYNNGVNWLFEGGAEPWSTPQGSFVIFDQSSQWISRLRAPKILNYAFSRRFYWQRKSTWEGLALMPDAHHLDPVDDALEIVGGTPFNADGRNRIAVTVAQGYIAMSINGSAPIVSEGGPGFTVPRPADSVGPDGAKRFNVYDEDAGIAGYLFEMMANVNMRCMWLYRKKKPLAALKKLSTIKPLPLKNAANWKTG